MKIDKKLDKEKWFKGQLDSVHRMGFKDKTLSDIKRSFKDSGKFIDKLNKNVGEKIKIKSFFGNMEDDIVTLTGLTYNRIYFRGKRQRKDRYIGLNLVSPEKNEIEFI